MSANVLLIFVAIYFLVLFAVARYTSRNSNNESFFIGNRSSNWMLVAFGMIGTSLSGLTFVSVPGLVGNIHDAGDLPQGFGYFQVVIGYLLGYIVIAYVLLPLYYRLNLTSIYNYLHQRFGDWAYKTGASFFILSRTAGATGRLYLVINILHVFILSQFHIPFWVSVAIVLIMILLYTYKGGVKTIVYTDTLQTSLMIIGLIVCIIYILSNLHLSVGDAVNAMQSKGLTRIFNTDFRSKEFFLKQIIGGAFITIAMTGLDQEMMQKNISVRTLRDSQKNILAFSIVLIAVNLMFLLLGGLLYLYAFSQGTVFIHAAVAGDPHAVSLFHSGINIAGDTNIAGDNLFPSIALGLMHSVPRFIPIIFIIALISALFPSADGALTALTSSFCIDILNLHHRGGANENKTKRIRWAVHISFAVIFFICILIFRSIGSRSIIGKVLDIATYTYGPLLGLFAFGILTKRNLPGDWKVVLVALVSPAICYLLQAKSVFLFGKYAIGLEVLFFNGLFTFIGLWLISKRPHI